MGAYREGHGTEPAAEGPEDGLVQELIQQFADPLAFYRELVQNSIDAGATSIAVTIGWEPVPDESSGMIEVVVRDDGCGMGREVLEDQLTVLFRSGKEGQEDKIGKFGVGFVSVLALEPERVTVRTSEGRGEQWTLHLRGDQSYELFRAGGGGRSGTTVSLRVPRPEAEVDAFILGSERALRKWCRHAEIPIRLVASRPGAELLEARIEEPLGLDALAQVHVEEGGTRVVAGLPKDARPYLGFFNRGLLLHETRKDIFGSVMVSIQDSRLEHTLSRDNVRRDAHYEAAMRLARRVVERHLTGHVHDLLGAVASRRRSEPNIEVLALAALNAGLALDERAACFPLLEPRGSDLTVTLRELRRGTVFVARERDALTQAAARGGAIVLDLGAGGDAAVYRAVLERLLERALPPVEQALTLAAPVDTSGSDGVLLERLGELLGQVARTPRGPLLASFQGARSGALSVAGGHAELPVVLDLEECEADPFRLLRRPTLLLDADHSLVQAARGLAVEDPARAAALLGRAILLDRGLLDAGRDERWLEAAFVLMGES